MKGLEILRFAQNDTRALLINQKLRTFDKFEGQIYYYLRHLLGESKMPQDDLLQQAKEFHQEALAEFTQAVEAGNNVLLRDACEKGWNAMVLATNYLVFKKDGKEVRSHWERQRALDSLEKRDPLIQEKALSDKFSARAYYLHQEAFYGGYLEEEKVRKRTGEG